jgi:molybdopterin-guanine dinucleotide biosynthesis protein A
MRGEPVPGVAGLVLTGGSSRRMGRDKATLAVEGRPLAERVGRRLSSVVAPALEVGPGRSGLPVADEARPGAGPLAAAVAGWRALTARGHHGPVVVVACDLPNVSAPLLRFLATRPGSASVVPVVDGRPQPLCARFSPAALDHGATMVGAGWRSMTTLLQHRDVQLLERSEWSQVAGSADFDDVDTPADLARLGLVAE